MLDIEVIENKEKGFVSVIQKNGNIIRRIRVEGRLGSEDTAMSIANAISMLSDARYRKFDRHIDLDKYK